MSDALESLAPALLDAYRRIKHLGATVIRLSDTEGLMLQVDGDSLVATPVHIKAATAASATPAEPAPAAVVAAVSVPEPEPAPSVDGLRELCRKAAAKIGAAKVRELLGAATVAEVPEDRRTAAAYRIAKAVG